MRHYILFFLLLLQTAILCSAPAHAQRGLRRTANVAKQDTPTVASQDTALVAVQDSVSLATPKGDIETTIKYSARDSMQLEADNKIVHLYGDAKINYGDMNLEAAYIQINYETNTLTATTLPDSTGKETGTPVFKQGEEQYAAKRIAYNYKTRKGRISDVVTQQGEGYIHSEVVKRNENNEFFGLHNKYTTCNLEHPHFYINAGKIKAIPDDKVMAGPFNLVIGDIPTPLGFLFGLFPTPKTKRASGVIVPSYGENRARGFFLNDGGYYFAWNDYMGTRLTGDIFSLGGYEVEANTDYVKRYAYRGSFNFSYSYFKNDEADIVASEARSTDNVFAQLPPSQRTFWIRWSHSPVTKPGRGSFSASVNAGSQLHQRVNYQSSAQYLSPTFNSNVSYQKTIPNSPFSYTVKASQGQSTQSGTMNFVLPDLSFSMSQVTLSELFSDAPATNKWYEKFTLGYNVRASNTISNVQPARTRSDFPLLETAPADTIDVNFDNLQRLWESGQKQAVHAFNIGLGNYKIARYFNFSPSVSYSETWLDEKYSYRFNADSQRVDIDTTSFGRVYQYSAGASLSTTVYGTVNFKQGSKVEAIRHLVRPSISYSYRPDFADEKFGFYQQTLVGTDPTTNEAVYRDLGRFRSGLPGPGLSSALSFGISNSVEMKVKAKSDTAEVKTEKVSLIDNLQLNSGYDFARDSLKLAAIRISLNTKLFKFINMNFNSTLDPYEKDSSGQSIDSYYFDLSKGRLGRFSNAGLNLTASLNPEAFRTQEAAPDNLPSLEKEPFDPLSPRYVDFKIPWTLNLSYSLNYNRSFGINGNSSIIQTLGIDGSLNVTEKWKVTYNATYDISNKNISYANVQIYRDLHCWDMSIGWVPFGLLRGYNLTINARSSLLQDLKLTKRSSTGYNY